MNIPRIDGQIPYLVVDTETTGLKWWEDHVFGVSIALPDGTAGYWDVRATPKILDWMVDLIAEDRVGVWVGHNFKFDLHFLREARVGIPTDRID